MDLIQITSPFTSIIGLPDAIRYVDATGAVAAAADDHDADCRALTGARVILEFARPEPLPANCTVRARYDMAGNGEFREITGTPALTHVTRIAGGLPSYHYRLSHWIDAQWVMEFS